MEETQLELVSRLKASKSKIRNKKQIAWVCKPSTAGGRRANKWGRKKVLWRTHVSLGNPIRSTDPLDGD